MEAGSHDELIARAERGEGPGMYWAMWQKQIRAEKLQRRKSQGEKELESLVVTTDEETDAGGSVQQGVGPAVDGVGTGTPAVVTDGPSSSDGESVAGTLHVHEAVEDSGPSTRPSTAESEAVASTSELLTSELVQSEEAQLSRSSSQHSNRFSRSRSNSGGSGFAKLKQSFRRKKGKEADETEHLLHDPSPTNTKKKSNKK